MDADSIVAFGTSGGGMPALGIATTGKTAAVAVGEPATTLWMVTDENGVLVEEEEFAKNEFYGESRTMTEVLMDNWLRAAPLSIYTPKLQAAIRRKLAGTPTPIFLLQGDRHGDSGIMFANFVGELAGLGRPVQAKLYPGVWHGFHWGRHTTSPETTFQVANDLDALFKRSKESYLGFTGLCWTVEWWSQAGSNRRPLQCHCSALPAELWPHVLRPFPGAGGLLYRLHGQSHRNRHRRVSV